MKNEPRNGPPEYSKSVVKLVGAMGNLCTRCHWDGVCRYSESDKSLRRVVRCAAYKEKLKGVR